jgi:hypothetical protein
MAVLADSTLRSGIARKISGGEPQADALGAALLAIPADTPPAAIYFALALLYEVHVTSLLERGAHDVWRGSTPDGEAFAAVLPAVTRADLPCGPARLASADAAFVRKEADLTRVSVSPEVAAVVEGLTARAGGALPSLLASRLV